MLYEIKVPETGFGIAEATIVEWFKGVGDNIQEGEIVLSVETEKVNVDIPAPGSGILQGVHCRVDDVVPVGQVLGLILSEAEAEKGTPLDEKNAALSSSLAEDTTPKARPIGKKIRISRLARNIARSEGIDVAMIPSGSGPGGRIIKEDVLKLAAENNAKKKTPGDIAAKAIEPPPIQTPSPGEKVQLSSWRKVIADRMTTSWQQIPHHAQSIDIDVTHLAQYIADTKNDPSIPRLTYLPFLMKAIQSGIQVTPEINAHCFKDHYVIQKDLHIGIAVDVDDKLLVPVIKQVQDKSILELTEELSELVGKARTNKLAPKDVQGGTLTISNVGVLGLFSGFSIIVPPQTTIVCVGAVRDVPSVVNGTIEIRKKMFVTNSYDHRVVHGGPASRFFTDMKNKLENLNALLLKLH
ncbi:MAG: 2-oxo acid dehydrogenase subunit E2 [bacterium]|nr:2-oxo acid dehydrogenase subunit E2 [bacterium]